MEHAELTGSIDAYLEDNWETMVGDIETLVRIPSFEELGQGDRRRSVQPRPEGGAGSRA